MKFLDNFLTSRYNLFIHDEFPNDNLQKFRFTLLNSILIIASTFTFLNYVASMSGFITLNYIYETILLLYTIINIFLISLLRKGNKTYILTTNILIISSLFLFYAALLTAPTNEFRLIWFFLVLFGSFVLMGKKYGMSIMLFILSSIFIINHYISLNYSRLALFTFFNSFLIFTAFAYSFLNKIEKDAIEFETLNTKLKEKVSYEIDQRHKQEQMLLQQCRLASMGEMIDSIAHQWRQPLMNINAILMNMDRAIETKEKPKVYLEAKMEEVSTLTTHMSQTIEDFRSLLRADKEKTHFHVNKSVEKAIEIYEESLKGIHLHIDNDYKLTFHGYNNELMQIVLILLHNAIDALQTKEIIEKNIFIHISTDNKRLLLSIEDTAGGIDKKYLPKIFDPYFTTKDAIGGTGLGLYIAKIITEQNMHGFLTAENTKKGAKFTVRVPNI